MQARIFAPEAALATAGRVRRRILIASRVLGASGQPWLGRQIKGLHGFETTLLCWDRRTPSGPDPLQDFRTHVMTTDAAPYDGPLRWTRRLRNLRSGNFYAAAGRERREINEVLRAELPDIVVCYFGDIAMRMLPAAQEQHVPLIAYLHGDFLFNSNRWYRHSLRHCLSSFAAIVAVTQAESQWLLEQGVPPSKVHVIPCGAPTDVFRPADREPHSTVTFVMCSRLAAEKGCDISLRSFAEVAATIPDVRLSVYGDGPSRRQLEALTAQLRLTDRVTFHGYVGEHVVASALRSCDVLIQHSLTKEGSPVSIAEAMACGLPVVTTPVGGMVDQVVDAETGFLVPQGNVGAMASAMRRLAVDAPLRRKMGQAARVRAIVAFDSSRQTDRLGQVIATALRECARVPSTHSTALADDTTPAGSRAPQP